MHAVTAAFSSSAPPSTTASLRITRRSAVIEPLFASSTVENPLTALARPTTPPVRFEKVHRALQRRLAHEDHLSKREHITSSTLAVTAGRKATSTAASPTATSQSVNSPVSPSTPAVIDAQQSCSYVGRTSIPKGAGEALFSTLERIFAGAPPCLSSFLHSRSLSFFSQPSSSSSHSSPSSHHPSRLSPAQPASSPASGPPSSLPSARNTVLACSVRCRYSLRVRC